MVVDPSFSGLPDFVKDIMVPGHTILPNSNYSRDLYFLGNAFPPPALPPAAEPYAPSAAAGSLRPTSMGASPPSDSSSDESEYSETVLKFMTQILMEDNIEDKPCMFFDPLGLQITEKSFYDALGKKYPPSPNQYKLPSYINHNPDTKNRSHNGPKSNFTNTDPQWLGHLGEYNSSFSQATLPGQYVSQPDLQSNRESQPFANPSNGVSTIGDGLELLTRNFFTDTESMLQFRRGLEEASKFLPRSNQMVIDLERSNIRHRDNPGSFSKVSQQWEGEGQMVVKSERGNLLIGSRGRKNHEREDVGLEEGRINKQPAVSAEENELSDLFDEVLLSTDALSTLGSDNKVEQNEASNASYTYQQPQEANGGKNRTKKQRKKKDTVDLRTLLNLCAQAVSAGDNRTANELLKQIREHSSPFGVGSQRLAHFFANGLEARLAGTGTGTQIFYTALVSKKISTYEIINSYKVHLSVCPFKRISVFFADQMIYKVAEKATSLHIIDFGIQYGFQWPILIQKLSKRSGGPPKLRITGIELPQPGFRPTETLEETGRRLGKYCERFNVPFEYHVIASQSWETIQIEDLKIDRNEMLAVNCLYRFKNLLDETFEVETSPRNAVLNLIRRMNPNIFVYSVCNGAYNAPFFVTRFREALFHFSALYDIFEVTLPRENKERLLFEREFYGREAMNVIASEGLERVERPETYRQWQVRTMRAGFRQLPLDKDIVNILRSKLKEWHHKDFVLDEDNHWMLQGWKGRIVYASSCWVPA
ncbi:hypothetical protein F2P56_032508 [Juglans regia]|uniref:Scarecrow-like protein 34 n=2 Tax=Juglans regia TaxID=51240 RepID=A0A2I4H2U5_JUGRE|nr:scarecrow-like protein 34 [Juglans regia]KAF5446913.1 hypothetical protein F2P56_032508 [Juglans regia]